MKKTTTTTTTTTTRENRPTKGEALKDWRWRPSEEAWPYQRERRLEPGRSASRQGRTPDTTTDNEAGGGGGGGKGGGGGRYSRLPGASHGGGGGMSAGSAAGWRGRRRGRTKSEPIFSSFRPGLYCCCGGSAAAACRRGGILLRYCCCRCSEYWHTNDEDDDDKPLLPRSFGNHIHCCHFAKSSDSRRRGGRGNIDDKSYHNKCSQHAISSCDIIKRVCVHRSGVGRSCKEFTTPGVKSQGISPKSKDATNFSFLKKWPRSIFKSWLIGNVIFLSFIAQLAAPYTAASPAKSSSSSPKSSSPSSNARYHLLPPSLNATIFIHFNPPSLRSLRVNTRERVFFNFTIHQRNGPSTQTQYHHPQLLQKQQQLSDSDDGSFNKGHGGNSKNSNNNNNNVDVNIINSVQPTNTFLGRNDSDRAKAVTSSSTLPPVYQFSQSPSATTPVGNVSAPEARSSSSSSSSSSTTTTTNNGTRRGGYWVMVYSSNDYVARPVLPAPGSLDLALARSELKAKVKGLNLFMAVSPGTQHNFSIEGRHLGRVSMSVAVVDMASDRGSVQPHSIQAVAAYQYSVTTMRPERTADTVFNSAAAAIALLISFGMGAATEVDSLKRQLKYPVSLVIAFCCQFIAMPVIAFGIAMALPLDEDISFGLLCVACVPGGGLGHVAVIIADGDTALSMTVNLVSVVAMLGTAPLWIFVLGQYFKTESDAAFDPRMIPIFSFEIWLLATFAAYALGLLVKRFKPAVADALLMWLIKPILLLASILYITLGVYINMYVFDLVKEFALLGAMLLPLGGCLIGGLMAAICRQGGAFVKTIALETCSFNCLVVLVALRFSLGQPDADLAAMIPIWVMFTIPGLFVLLAIVTKIKNTIMHYWNNRNSGGGGGSGKDPELLGSSKAYSVSSSVVSPPGTTTLSAPLVVADGADDDLTISTMSNQKVTVL